MLKLFKTYSNVLLLILVWLECAFFFSWDIIFGCTVILYGWTLISYFILDKSVLIKHPVIFIVSLGVGLFYFYFPLIGTLMSNRPLTYQFRMPFEVFIHQFVFITVYVGSFLLYLNSNIRPIKLRKILKKFKIFYPPTDLQLWLMGLIGVITFVYVKIGIGISQLEAKDVSPLVRFLLPFINFIYAPILINFKRLYTKEIVMSKKLNVRVYLYVVVLVLLSFLGNGRQFMISSIMVLLLLYFFVAFLFKRNLKQVFPPRLVILFLIISIAIVGPLEKMANAMLIVRNERANISAIELFDATILAFNSSRLEEKSNVTKYKENNFSWEEDYTGNIFFDRLCNLKIADMTLYYVSKANVNPIQAQNDLSIKILAQLPTPVLDLLGFEINKYDSEIPFTVASKVKDITIGYSSGGKTVAAHSGTGIYLFGEWYPLIFMLIYLLLFYIFDSFILIQNGVIHYSALFLINIFYFFTFLNFKDGIISDMLFIGRPYIQMCFIYIFLFHFTEILSKFFRFRTKKLQLK